MGNEIRRATRQKAKLRLGIAAPSGAGKTYSALLIAFGLGGKIGLVDSENGSGDLYAHLGEYDILRIAAPFTAAKYLEAIHAFEMAGYNTIIIDSLSHAWAGSGGLLDKQGKIADGGGNSFAAWRKVTPDHNALVDAMLQSPCHIIGTMRSKQEYVLEADIKGKMVPKKVGMAPVQREGMEYEFTICFEMDMEHAAHATKDRTSLFDGLYFKPTKETGKQLLGWLELGIDPIEQQFQTPTNTPISATQVQQQVAKLQEAGEQLTAKGVLEEVKSRDTENGKKYGLKLVGVGKAFITHSAAAAERAMGFIGKEIIISYRESTHDGKKQYDMLGF